MSKAVQHLQNISIADKYGTPLTLYYEATTRYGIRPILDVCADRINHVTDSYFTEHDNALTKQWNVDFYMNPPYSKIRDFIKYAYEQHKKHNVNGLLLTYAKTDTKWWHDYVESKAEIYFIKGRIKFFDEHGILTKNSAPYPSCWLVYRRKILN